MKTLPYICTLGLLHGVADASTGFLVIAIPLANSVVTTQQAGLFLLVYNALAFALQPAFGWGLDALRRPRKYAMGAAGGLGLVIVALLLSRSAPLAAVAVAGCGSALFHVGAGAMAMSERRALHCGAFAGPGVVGQGIGMSVAFVAPNATLVFVTLLSLVTVFLALAAPPALTIDSLEPTTRPAFRLTQLQGTLLLLMLVIALRSSVWTLWAALAHNDKMLVVSLPIAAGVGKLAGGVFSEKWDATRYAMGALVVSGFLLSGGDTALADTGRHALVLIGVACLQSATPGALVALKTALPYHPAFAAGLGFGLAIALGGLPELFHISLQPWILPISLGAAALFFLASPRQSADRLGVSSSL